GGVLYLLFKRTTIGIAPTILATLFFVLGLAGMLFHATCEKETQLRRAYGLFGVVWLGVGLVLIGLNIARLSFAANLFLPGIVCLPLGLFYLLAFIRNEEEREWHDLAVLVLGIAGAALALLGFIGGNASSSFLIPNGSLLALLGLGFLWAFVV